MPLWARLRSNRTIFGDGVPAALQAVVCNSQFDRQALSFLYSAPLCCVVICAVVVKDLVSVLIQAGTVRDLLILYSAPLLCVVILPVTVMDLFTLYSIHCVFMIIVILNNVNPIKDVFFDLLL